MSDLTPPDSTFDFATAWPFLLVASLWWLLILSYCCLKRFFSTAHWSAQRQAPHQHQNRQQQRQHQHLQHDHLSRRPSSTLLIHYQPSAPPRHEPTVYYVLTDNNDMITLHSSHAHSLARGQRAYRPSSMNPSPSPPPPPAAATPASSSASVSHRPFDTSQLLVEFPSSESHVDMPCPVCLEPLGEPQGQLAAPPCTHAFHVDCIRQWLHRDPERTCPSCRQSFTQYSADM